MIASLGCWSCMVYLPARALDSKVKSVGKYTSPIDHGIISSAAMNSPTFHYATVGIFKKWILTSWFLIDNPHITRLWIIPTLNNLSWKRLFSFLVGHEWSIEGMENQPASHVGIVISHCKDPFEPIRIHGMSEGWQKHCSSCWFRQSISPKKWTCFLYGGFIRYLKKSLRFTLG